MPGVLDGECASDVEAEKGPRLAKNQGRADKLIGTLHSDIKPSLKKVITFLKKIFIPCYANSISVA